MSIQVDSIEPSASGIDIPSFNQVEPGDTHRRATTAVPNTEDPGVRGYGVNRTELSKIREFFPFRHDIIGEVVEVSTMPTTYGKKNSITSTQHTVTKLEDSTYFSGLFASKGDKTYRWIHLPGNDMNWFEVILYHRSHCSYQWKRL
jgi:hypothetical protein